MEAHILWAKCLAQSWSFHISHLYDTFVASLLTQDNDKIADSSTRIQNLEFYMFYIWFLLKVKNNSLCAIDKICYIFEV